MQELKGLKPPVKGTDKINVSIEIERLYHLCLETSYLQACIEFCDLYDYDIETIPKIISVTLKDKIYGESINANLIRGESPNTRDLDKWL